MELTKKYHPSGEENLVREYVIECAEKIEGVKVIHYDSGAEEPGERVIVLRRKGSGDYASDPYITLQAHMMHGTTSPFYPMIASIDVATSMMDEPAGPTMMQETVLDAIGLRKAIASVARKLAAEGGQNSWFFSCYQPENVSDPRTGEQFNFVDAPDELLANESSCWMLKPGDRWHGFKDDCLDEDYCMLDPTKVTIICPGISPEGQISDWGIPGAILTRFLDSRRIEIARTGDYTVLVLFSVGSSKGKWGTLLEALIEFKRLYDSGAAVSEVIPDLVAEYPESYSLNGDKPMPKFTG